MADLIASRHVIGTSLGLDEAGLSGVVVIGSSIGVILRKDLLGAIEGPGTTPVVASKEL